jgi:penicillin-binding protein 1C
MNAVIMSSAAARARLNRLFAAIAPLLRRVQCWPWRRIAAIATLVMTAGLGLEVWSRAELEKPQASVLLRDRHDRFLGEIMGQHDEGFGYWPLEKLPERVAAATLVVEDRRFWRHPGVDPTAMVRAAWQNLSNRERISGASTLAMQIARMQRPGSRTYWRKGVEALTALALTARVGKEAVLRHYLEIVPYGNRIHGISYAARRYLDKPVEDLSWAEVAFLTAIPQAPARMNPFDPRGRRRAIARGERILALLLEHEYLSEAEHELALAEISTLRIPPRGERPRQAMHALLAYDDLLTRPEHQKVVASNPVVTTTIDLEIQREVAWMTFDAVESWDQRGAGNAAAIVLDTTTREVISWVGSTDYFDDRHAGAIDFVRVERSPGSTLKPFLYALALERGIIGPQEGLDDLNRGAGGIGNSDERYLGPLLPRVALANSRNVPAANLLERVGLDDSFDFLGDLGLHDRTKPADHYGLGLAIGGMPATLEKLARAYLVLANDGILGDLTLYRNQPLVATKRVLSEESARQISLFLSDPMARLPSFPRVGNLEYPIPVAVKTGTSSNYHDAWTFAYSRRYLVGVWVGHPGFRPMDRLSGYRSAALLVRRILLWLHRDQITGLEDIGFPPPRGTIQVRLCALTGQRASAACDRVVTEFFHPGAEPVDSCHAHVQRAIDIRTGLLAGAKTPREYVDVRTFADLGPRYAEWQVAAGLPHPPQHLSQLDGPANDDRRVHRLVSAPATATIGITEPTSDLHLLRDPEAPADRCTLALRATVDPPTEQIVWYVDDEPFAVADYPYSVRWPLTPGRHTIQARIPFVDSRSNVVEVVVY